MILAEIIHIGLSISMEDIEWKQARQWLISSGVIPPTHHITKPSVEFIDFVLALRDGVFLCGLLEKLKPGSCLGWNPKPVMQVSAVAINLMGVTPTGTSLSPLYE